MILYLHGLTPHSTVNGPGRRTVVHTQGCSLGCKGCFNPLTHSFEGGTPWSVEALVNELQRIGDEGVTWSGGEPTEQLPALLEIVTILKTLGYSQLLFSGRTREEIEALPQGRLLLEQLDVLVDGRYQPELSLRLGLRGSANQTLHLLSSRHRLEELERPAAQPVAELRIAPDGTILMSGFPSPQLAQSIRRNLGQANKST